MALLGNKMFAKYLFGFLLTICYRQFRFTIHIVDNCVVHFLSLFIFFQKDDFESLSACWNLSQLFLCRVLMDQTTSGKSINGSL